jgi:hypothetical protein
MDMITGSVTELCSQERRRRDRVKSIKNGQVWQGAPCGEIAKWTKTDQFDTWIRLTELCSGGLWQSRAAGSSSRGL